MSSAKRSRVPEEAHAVDTSSVPIRQYIDRGPFAADPPKRPEAVQPYVALFAQHPHVGIETNAATEAEFVRLFADEVCRMLRDWPASLGDNREATVAAWLAHSMDIGCKMRGYKSEEVIESRVLYRGTLRPSNDAIVNGTITGVRHAS